VKAFDFRDLWNKLDTSGDRMVTLNELTNIIPKEGHPPPHPSLPPSLLLGLTSLWSSQKLKLSSKLLITTMMVNSPLLS
jgi:hypothetical protein